MLGMGKLAPVWSKVSGLTVTHGEGSHVYTVEGDRYLDFTSGIAVASTGHAHPVVVEAISQQAKRFLHAQVNCYHHDLLQPLADLLDDITPAGIDTFFYTNSGAEATEAAVKLAKQIKGALFYPSAVMAVAVGAVAVLIVVARAVAVAVDPVAALARVVAEPGGGHRLLCHRRARKQRLVALGGAGGDRRGVRETGGDGVCD